ncbi:DUF6385 domain-containing protein [Paenibacillus kobensis]|uniref:DUF6385 domain-containing protein n=1 Tax=Paenibacillus kobensis TaxID=59841 RepID=UPI000FDBD83E|nr:DUF6385 domain-containing protein [Paenibacillus kobensis]
MTSAPSRGRKGGSSYPSSGCKHKRGRRPRKRSCDTKRRHARSLFVEQVFADVRTTDEFAPLPKQSTAHLTVYSYAVINEGGAPAVAQVQVGPDGDHFAADVEETIMPGQTRVMAVARFQRFTRLTVRSKHEDQPTTLTVYFQAQALC